MKQQYDFVIIGSGIIGTTFAYLLSKQEKGKTICIVSDNSKKNTSMISAGILPVLYATDEMSDTKLIKERILLLKEIGIFFQEVEKESKQRIESYRNGSLMMSATSGDFEEIENAREIYNQNKIDNILLSGDECRKRFFGIGEKIQNGLLTTDDRSVNPYLLIYALLEILKQRDNVDFFFGEIKSFNKSKDGESLKSITLNTVKIEAGAFIFATGAWSESSYPIRGALLEISEDQIDGKKSPVFRGCRSANHIYFLRRENGNGVIGATFCNMGYRDAVELSEIYNLLRDSLALFPSLENAEFSKVKYGFRAMSNSNKIEYNRFRNCNNTVEVVGHYRDGLLYCQKIAFDLIKTFFK